MPDPPGAADVFVRNGDPRLAGLRAWAIRHGVSTYERFLLTHPGVALSGPIDDYRQLLAPEPAFAPAGFSAPASGAFVAVSPRTIGELIPWGAAIAVLAVAAFALGPRRRLVLVPVSGCAAAVVASVLVWNSDPAEIDRIAVPQALLLRCSLIVLLALSVDGLASRPRPQPEIAARPVATPS
jgi:hypothetical protein